MNFPKIINGSIVVWPNHHVLLEVKKECPQNLEYNGLRSYKLGKQGYTCSRAILSVDKFPSFDFASVVDQLPTFKGQSKSSSRVGCHYWKILNV